MSLDKYLELVDWSGRQLKAGQKGVIPNHLEPILKRLDVNPDQWYRSCRHFGSLFFTVAGKLSNMAAAAQKAGQLWHKGKVASRKVFT